MTVGEGSRDEGEDQREREGQDGYSGNHRFEGSLKHEMPHFAGFWDRDNDRDFDVCRIVARDVSTGMQGVSIEKKGELRGDWVSGVGEGMGI